MWKKVDFFTKLWYNTFVFYKKERSSLEIYGLNFIKGKINNKQVVLAEAGVGKVNAARTTQILIDKFDIDAVINVGSAGASNDELNIGDIVIGKKLVQHDFDITAFGHPKGYISNAGEYFNSCYNFDFLISCCW